MKKTDLKEVQLAFNDEGEIVEDTHKDSLETEKVEYEKLDKVDLVRLCKEKDACLQSYETERGNMTEAFNNEINNMNEYYTKRIKELKSLLSYYERKFVLIKDLIDIEKEKEAKKNDTVQ